MKTKLFTIAMMVALLLADITRGQAQEYDGPCLPSMHGLDDHQSAFCGSTETQTIALVEGWNNISLFIKADDDPIAMLDMLKEGLGDNAEIIEGDEGITSYEGDGEWFGDLDELGVTNVSSYMILVTNDCSFVLVGEAVNPADYVITINPGWNMIGFPSAEELEITVALSDFEAEIDDIIESPDGMTMHEGDGEWFGDIETFVPGQGYLYFSNSDEVKYLVIQTGGSKARVKAVSPNKTKKPRLGLNDKQ